MPFVPWGQFPITVCWGWRWWSPEFLINGFLTTKRTLKSGFQVDVWVENTVIYPPCIPFTCPVTLRYLKLKDTELGCWGRGRQHRRERARAPQARVLQVLEPRQACTAPLCAHRHGLMERRLQAAGWELLAQQCRFHIVPGETFISLFSSVKADSAGTLLTSAASFQSFSLL